MNEKMKCFNIHGHTYLCELKFAFDEMKDIGYAIDFKEIKRVGCQWIDDMLDHGMILNPHDNSLISTTLNLNSKLWLMSLNGVDQYCNPSAENISKEIFLAMEVLFKTYSPSLVIHKIILHETPNCSVECIRESITGEERENWISIRFEQIDKYARSKGVYNYDDRES